MPGYLPAYYHPATVCFAHGADGYLRRATRNSTEHWLPAHFDAAEGALLRANAPLSREPLVERCFSPPATPATDARRTIDLGVLAQEIRHIERFSQVSVLVLDWPDCTESGIAFLGQVENPTVKRLLLTREFDARAAVTGFNDGLLDGYLSKTRLNGPEEVIAHCKELQLAYFRQFNARLTDALHRTPLDFLSDDALTRHITGLIDAYAVTEYYLAIDPPGFLMLTREGSPMLCVIQDRALQAQSLATMQRYGAPEALVTRVAAGSHVCCLVENPEDYPDPGEFPWSECILPASPAGKQWRVAVLPDPPMDIDIDVASNSFSARVAKEQAHDRRPRQP